MTSRYGRPLEFGVSVVPASADIDLARSLARHPDELGLDPIGIQDHPYYSVRGLHPGPAPAHQIGIWLGFDTFVFWPDDEPLDQLQRFAGEIVPRLRR